MLYDSVISYIVECNNVAYNVEKISIVLYSIGSQYYMICTTIIVSIFVKWLHEITVICQVPLHHIRLIFQHYTIASCCCITLIWDQCYKSCYHITSILYELQMH